MTRLHKILILFAVVAIPAAAYGTFSPPDDGFCFASGSATYRLSSKAASPDFRVRIAPDAPHADLRMQLVDRPERADFVLVDDFSAARQGACRSTTPIRTVKVEDGAGEVDVVVNLTSDDAAADYRVYVHSVRFAQRDAAALLAAMWKADRRRELAARN